MRRTSVVYLPFLLLLLFLAACGGEEAGGVTGDPARGETLYRETNIGPANAPGCITCHSTEPGEVKAGPSHAGLATRAAEIVNDPGYTGQATTAEAYLRESIVEPNAYVVEGFVAGVMYQNYGEELSEQELADLVAFMMTLK